MKEETENKCPYCGGPMVIEYFGQYGSVYKLKKDGEPSKRRLHLFIYEETADAPLIYWWDCRKAREELL